MFKPKTERIEVLARIFPKVIKELEDIFNHISNVYIDWQNVIHWQDKLGWHIHTKRLKQFLDLNKNDVDNFVLWSGDSDFVDPINAVIKMEKQICIFSTSGSVSSELSELKMLVFEIKKMREFICWPKEIPQSIKDKIDK